MAKYTAENLTWSELDSLIEKLREKATRGGGRDEANGYWIGRAELARGIPFKTSPAREQRAREDIAGYLNSCPWMLPQASLRRRILKRGDPLLRRSR